MGIWDAYGLGQNGPAGFTGGFAPLRPQAGALAPPPAMGGAIAPAAVGGGALTPATPASGSGYGWLDSLHNTFVNDGGMMMGLASGLLGAPSMREGLARGMQPAMVGMQLDQQQKEKNLTRATLDKALAADKSLTAENRAALLSNPQMGMQYLVQSMKPKERQVTDVNGNLVDYTDPNNVKTLFSAPKTQANDMLLNYQTRQMMAEQQGLKPDDPAYKSFMLTGKMPREDAQSLTATDKKAILEGDEAVATNQNAITLLNKAKELSKKAYDGTTAGARGWLTSQWGNEGGNATQELHQVVTEQALGSLRSIFGGNPTEGERAILMEIQGSENLPQAVRDKIYDRAIAAATRRLQFNQERAAALRGGTYYKEGGQPGGVPSVQPQAPGATGQPPPANASDPYGIR